MVEVREAEYFIAVAEELHFGRAADRLRMSQPPLSQAIRQLERRLGVELLHRTTRSVTLTSAGVAFLSAARDVVGASRAADLTARRAGSGLVGELRIGAVTSAFADPLPALLGDYQGRFPDVGLVLEEIDTHQAPQALLGHDLDVAIARVTGTVAGLDAMVLSRDRFLLVTPAVWPESDSPHDLSEVAWVWIPQ